MCLINADKTLRRRDVAAAATSFVSCFAEVNTIKSYKVEKWANNNNKKNRFYTNFECFCVQNPFADAGKSKWNIILFRIPSILTLPFFHCGMELVVVVVVKQHTFLLSVYGKILFGGNYYFQKIKANIIISSLCGFCE